MDTKKTKKKILLLSDDLRMFSGVAVMSKEIVYNTIKEFDWVQIGGSLKNPDTGKILDLSDSINKELNITDAYCKIYPVDGYGNQQLLRQLIHIEKPDAILHFTDPRFWGWLYSMEHEIRQSIPILYYNIWDDVPFPHYNKSYYECSDMLMCISKQTKVIVDEVVGDKKPNWAITYLPHGVNDQVFKPIDETSNEYMTKSLELFGNKQPKFVVLYNNRNIRRKNPADLILTFKAFLNKLTPEAAKDCYLILHTQAIDDAGTNLFAVKELICPNDNVIIDESRPLQPELNVLYNIADVTVNIASNEGFGLGTLESILAGTPIIVNVTGGLQDQCGFIDENGKIYTPTADIPTNHAKTFTKCGEWAFPVFPTSRSLSGSIPTPYIFDDRCDWKDVADRLHELYMMTREERKQRGLKGREYAQRPDVGMTAELMGKAFIRDINIALINYAPRDKYNLYNSNEFTKEIKNTGIIYE